MKEVRLLKEIASGVPVLPEKDISGRDARGQTHIDRSEAWFASNKNKDPMLTLRGWRNDILSGWEDTENNSDYRSKTELDLITKVVGSEDKAKMSMIQN